MSEESVEGRGPALSGRWTAPRIVPPSWSVHEYALDGATWVTTWNLSIIATVSTERDGREWVHVSVAHIKRLPTWEELRDVRDVLIGDREAYQVFPTRDRYVNEHPNCLHFFACLDGPQLPDFRVSIERNQI